MMQQAACYSSCFSLIETLTVSGRHEDWHHEVSRWTQNTLTTCNRLKMELFCIRAWPHLQHACWNDSMQGFTHVHRDEYSIKALFVLLTPKPGSAAESLQMFTCTLNFYLHTRYLFFIFVFFLVTCSLVLICIWIDSIFT